MKRKTIEQAIKDGLEAGDKVMIEAEYQYKNSDGSIFLYSHNGDGIAISKDTKVFVKELTEAAPEATTKLKVGQYWHYPESDGSEWLVKENKEGNIFECVCTHEGDGGGWWGLGTVEPWDLSDFYHYGYVLGRHPDNIECTVRDGDVYEMFLNASEWKVINSENNKIRWSVCIKSGGGYELGKKVSWHFNSTDKELFKFLYNVHDQAMCSIARTMAAEQWQPKEGEFVWVKYLECKADFRGILDKKAFVECKDYNEQMFPVPLSELEPYTNQDKPQIDFSIPGQWLECDGNIVCTSGQQSQSGLSFWAKFLGNAGLTLSVFKTENWRVLTPEEINPILEAIEALKK